MISSIQIVCVHLHNTYYWLKTLDKRGEQVLTDLSEQFYANLSDATNAAFDYADGKGISVSLVFD